VHLTFTVKPTLTRKALNTPSGFACHPSKESEWGRFPFFGGVPVKRGGGCLSEMRPIPLLSDRVQLLILSLAVMAQIRQNLLE